MIRLLLRGVLALLTVGLIACSSPAPLQDAPTTVRVSWPRDPESLNPVVLPNAFAVQINNLLYQSLLVVDGPRRRYVPWLATALPETRRAGPITYLTYTIRPEATWDNGQPITGHDVLFSLRVLFCPGVPNERISSGLSFVRNLEIDPADARRFTFVCAGFAPEYGITSGDFPILPEYLLDPQHALRPVPLAELTADSLTSASKTACAAFAAQFNLAEKWRDPQQVRGSGPYELVSWQSGQRLVLRRKSKWWADKMAAASPMLAARPSRLEFHIIPDPTTALLALRRGDVDVYPNMPAADFERLRTSSDAARFHLYTPASYRMVALEMNTRQPMLRESATRQALLHLLDVPQLMRATQYGLGQLSVGLVSPRERWAYHDSLPLRSYNPQKAKALLRAAGWQFTGTRWQRHASAQGSQPLALQLHYRAGDRTFETAALLFQQAAKELKIPVSLRPTEASLLSEVRRNGQYDMVFRSFYGNPFSYDLRPILHTASIGLTGGNTSGFGTPSSDRLLEQLAAAEDSTQKKRLLHRLQLMLYEQAPLGVLFYEPNRLAVARRFADVRPAGPEPGYNLASFALKASAN
ncbi:ABC transporter substrate-binding protein [Hymenobacter busanensis]|uniref:ABC transporter substrate-binding protein n=1 Tax=Hymenobacter busanensis TaxID=2607656 RepID=A0A7L5A1W9_9BACT|nr:ABC transporter substrate-binding protein [Hymenobacter busanensis]KAA9338486.1 ABC transporter substrate-binding protein [Hymenobacter busanensis]QHJ09086.1 ABC transporter substrate-binding protein [Hymenobacter busanensis]